MDNCLTFDSIKIIILFSLTFDYFKNHNNQIHTFALLLQTTPKFLTNDLTIGKEGSIILRFAIPMLMANVFQQLYNIVDSIIIGRFLGNEALAAVGASFPLIFTLVSLIIGFTTGAAIIIAQYYGARNIEQVKRTIDTMYITLGVASVFLMLIGFVASPYIFRLIGLPEDVISNAVTYFRVTTLGFLFFFGFQGIVSALRGVGDSRTPLYFLIGSTILNVALDLIFVVVFGFGIAGVAFATIIAQALAFVCLVVYLNKNNKLMQFNFKMRFDKTVFVKSLKIGIPTGLQQTFVAVGMLALYKVVNMFGTTVIAAYAIAMRIDSFASMPAMNFSAALSSFVGQNIGAQKLDRIKRGLNATLKISISIAILMAVLSYCFATPIMRLFTIDEAVIEVGKQYLYFVSAFYVSFSIMFIFQGLLRGAGVTVVPMFISLLTLWVIRIPISYILSQRFGHEGIWWSIPITWTIGAILSFLYYKTGRWKNKRIIDMKD